MNLKKSKYLIKKYEGKRNTAYICPSGYWTIGYGHVIIQNGKMLDKNVKINDLPDEWKHKTDDEIEELLDKDCMKFYLQIKNILRQNLNENQASALISFTFNVGIGNLRNSSLLRYINSNNPDEYDEHYIKNQFNRWVFAGGVRLKGLEKRRIEEGGMFCETVDNNILSVLTAL